MTVAADQKQGSTSAAASVSGGGKEIVRLQICDLQLILEPRGSLVLFTNSIHRFPGLNLHFPGFLRLLIPLFRSAVAPLYLSPSPGFKLTFFFLRHI